MGKRGPRYSLAEARAAVARGNVHVTSRPLAWLANHGYEDVSEVVSGVFASMTRSDYYKTDELKNMSGTYADIYRMVPWDDEEWYVKFFFRSDGKMLLEVWSLNWEGAIH